MPRLHHPTARAPRAAAAAVAGTLLLAACGHAEADPAAAPEGTAGSGGRTVEHAMGTVEVPEDPQRVATIGEVLAGHVASVGVQPVAGTDDVDEWLAPYASAGLLPGVTPEEIEQIGTTEEPDLERLAVLTPDLILIEESSAGELYDDLSRIAPTMVVTRESNAAWQETFDQTVEAVGRQDEAEQVRQRYRELFTEVPPDAAETEVTFLRGAGPGQFRLDVRSGFGGSVADEAGYGVDRGAASEEEELASYGAIEYSNERLGVVDGDLLVTSTQEEGGPSNIEELTAGPLWGAIPAVRDGRVLELPQPVYNGGTYVAAELLLKALIEDTADGEGESR